MPVNPNPEYRRQIYDLTELLQLLYLNGRYLIQASQIEMAKYHRVTALKTRIIKRGEDRTKDSILIIAIGWMPCLIFVSETHAVFFF